VVGGGADADKSAAADIKKFQLLADLAAAERGTRFSWQRKKVAFLGKSHSAASLMHPRFTFSCLSALCWGAPEQLSSKRVT